MNAELVRTYRFEAAHRLPNAPEGHKCRRVHGHNYRLDVHVSGKVDAKAGWVLDFGAIDKLVKPLLDSLDHRMLTEIEGLENPTSEMIARYIFDRLKPLLADLSTVEIWESDNARCIYRGE